MADLAILPLGQIENTGLIGGKARALSQLIREGINVPPGFVITTAVFRRPDTALKAAIMAEFDQLKARKVAVRSSAVSEDGKDAAWAGQLDSVLNVNRAGLIAAVERCWKSADSPRARAYARQKGLAAGPAAVIVQKMIHGHVSGVAFSVHPVTQADQIIVEAVPGLAEALVSGNATPDSYLIDKMTGDYAHEDIRHGKPLLSADQLRELDGTIRKLEEYFKHPVDVEWTFLKGELYILQSRPITTLS